MVDEIEPILVGQFEQSEIATLIGDLKIIMTATDLTRDQLGFIEAFARAIAFVRLYVQDPASISYFEARRMRLVIAYSIGDKCNGFATEVEQGMLLPVDLAIVDAGSVSRVAVSSYALVSLLAPMLVEKPFEVGHDAESLTAIAQVILLGAILLLFLHEVGHCVRGHLPLWRELFGSATASESEVGQEETRAPVSARRARLRRALETDADSFAAHTVGMLWRLALGSESRWLPRQSSELIELLCCLSPLALSICLANAYNKPTEFYHSPLARALHMGGTMRSEITGGGQGALGFMFVRHVLDAAYRAQANLPTKLLWSEADVLADLECQQRTTLRDRDRLIRRRLLRT